MKKLLFSALTTLLISCGYNQQEQMLYDYINNGIKSTLKTEAKNVGFKIKEMKKIKEITANESAKRKIVRYILRRWRYI